MKDTYTAIVQLFAEFAYLIDRHNGVGVPALFTEDGHYEANGSRSTGREAIAEAYRLRAARGPRVSRHLFTNIRVTEESRESARCTAIMMLFGHDGEGVFPAEPLSIADVDDLYALTPAGPRIRARTMTTIFADPSSKPVLPLGHETA